jgi:5'-3' exonuclease
MIILIDFSNLVWSSFYSSLRYHKYEPENCPLDYTGHVDFFHQKLIKILQDQPCEDYLFVVDQKPRLKFSIFPEYKKSRKRIDFNPKPAVLKLLQLWGAKIVKGEYHEADDVIASYVANNLDTDICVASTDKDLWQLLENPKTKVYNFHKNNFVTKRELDEAYGLKDFAHIKLHKTLWGDMGDNVPNLVPRMQKNLLPLIMQTDGTLNNLWQVLEANWSTLSDRCKQILDENKDKLKVNYELVRLNFDCEYCVEIASVPAVEPVQVNLEEEISKIF